VSFNILDELKSVGLLGVDRSMMEKSPEKNAGKPEVSREDDTAAIVESVLADLGNAKEALNKFFESAERLATFVSEQADKNDNSEDL